MNKRLVVSLLLALTVGIVNAAPVSVEVARQIAKNFWNTYYPETQKPVSDMQLQPIDEMHNMYFFVNGEEGFVIVSADDRVRPILGYSFDSPFPKQLNPELRYWLSGYEQQIDYVKTIDKSADPRWNTLSQEAPATPLSLQVVPMLCSTRWDQGDPYNRLCPYDSNFNTRCVVGCVATAMAQIMKRWNHPSCGTGSRSYQHHSMNNNISYGVLSADFGHTTYRWEDMPVHVVNVATEPEAQSVSTISYHCGVAVDMMYGPSATGGSGAYSSCGYWASACATNAFYTYFKYRADLRYRERLNFDDSTWFAMIDAELAAGRPMYYDGSDASGGGHAFVLDGSNLDTCYHFNWGWSGYGNGYYPMSNLAPGAGGAGGNATYTFNEDQGAIFGIQPAEEIFDTVHVYDTVCINRESYTFYGYDLPIATYDTLLKYLDTIFYFHMTKINLKVLNFMPNGANGSQYSLQYCPVDSLTMPECTFAHPDTTLRFYGWCRNAQGNGDIYRAGEQYRLNFNSTLYAIWVDKYLNIVTAAEDGITLWPNPTGAEVNLRWNEQGTAQAYVIDAVGRTVMTATLADGQGKINLQALPAGVYTVHLRTCEGIYNKRIIKE